jgi:hypothetical protein
LLGDGDKGIERVYGEPKNILYWAKSEQKYLVPAREGKRTIHSPQFQRSAVVSLVQRILNDI